MRTMIVLAAASIMVGACGKAGAVVPDATNPAHCIAAFHWGAYWFATTTKSHAPNRDKIAEMFAHAKYEFNKIEAAGGSIESAKAESERLTKEYANDGDKLDKLMLDCSLAHAYDPEFRRQYPGLIAAVQSAAAKYPTR